MRRTVAITSLFLAWLCAHGAIWDLAQVFAWTRMFAGYAQTLPLGAALGQTFDLSKPCKLCCAIRRAKESPPQHLPAQTVRDTEKLILALESPAPLFLPRPVREWPDLAWTALDARVDPVPLPPPRV